MFPLPKGASEVLNAILPLFSFSKTEPTAESLEKFAADLSEWLDKSFCWLDENDLFTKALKWLRDKVSFAVWCLSQSFTQGTAMWSPKVVLELCTQQPSTLTTLKMLGGLQLVNQGDILTFLVNQPSSVNVYRGFLALNCFIQYLFKNFQRNKSSTIDLEEVENLILNINSNELSLLVLGDIFSLCFLRKEDILFEDTASDSGGEDDRPAECSNSRKSGDPSCPSNSNSPSNTQTGTSSTAALAGKKGDMSLGFLCQDANKLQVIFFFQFFLYVYWKIII